MDNIPVQVLQAVAERLNESAGADQAQWPQTAPNAILVCNALSLLLDSQRRSRPNAKPFKHRISWPPNQSIIRVDVMHLGVIDNRDLDALRALSERVRGLSFVFEQDNVPLRYGQITLEFIDALAERNSIPPRPAYVAPPRHNKRIFDIDWSDSVVLKADRELVLQIIDTVYNMHETMPADLTVSIESIEAHDYESHARAKRKATIDESSDATSLVPSGGAGRDQLLGYCIHFAGVPSFTGAFIKYLEYTYAGRFIGATVLFPQARPNNILIAPQLTISLSADHALVQQAKPYAQSGAKRLCRKVVRDD